MIGLHIPEGGISWQLWGFETHSFTVGEESISLRLDTSGAGPYEVAHQNDRVAVSRCGTVLWEGGFVPAEDCAALAEKALTAEGCRILEHITEGNASLVCSDPDGGKGYVFIVKIDGSDFGAVFHTPKDSVLTGEEALGYARRLRFIRLD